MRIIQDEMFSVSCIDRLINFSVRWSFFLSLPLRLFPYSCLAIQETVADVLHEVQGSVLNLFNTMQVTASVQITGVFVAKMSVISES